MNDLQHIYDVTDETFEAAVVAPSHAVPVLVDYWAGWCGPCQMQMPVLKKLVEEFAGQVLLAKVDTDAQGTLARDHGIRSLPTLRLYSDGSVVEEILGAQTEATLRALLERYVARPSDRIRLEARELARQGDTDTALARLQEAADADPDNHRIRLDQAGLTLQQGDCAAAARLLDTLPREIREEPEAMRLSARLGFAGIAAGAPGVPELEQRIRERPGDLEARHRLAARLVLDDRPEPALQQLLYILEQDRNFGDDAGRKGLLAVFDVLGNEGELVAEYRRKLFNSLH